jgi:outer membrane protein, multidrug efflux system
LTDDLFTRKTVSGGGIPWASRALKRTHAKSRSLRLTLDEQTATYAETARLANDRYRGGSTSFLEVLTTQQQYFTSELQSSQSWFAELQNYVQLYQALGGGWRP